jgi:hypothetical protein
MAATSRPSYAYNPDLPIRKWHQKWLNPIISLQNAPPATHGTPAPTKEDGDAGAAGFKVRAWIPLDEDDDVSDETLQQEVDWWSKPGAPMRPELREAQRPLSAVPMEVESIHEKAAEKQTQEDVVMTDVPAEPATILNGVVDSAPIEAPTARTETDTSPTQHSPPAVDAEMLDVASSPIDLPSVQLEVPLVAKTSPQPFSATSPHPITEAARSPLPPAEPIAAQSPSKITSLEMAEPPTLEDILPPSKPSPSDPVGQAEVVAAGLAPRLPEEKAENTSDPGLLSGAGGGIAGEGIAGGRDTDVSDTEEGNKLDGVTEGRTEEDQKIIDASREDMDTEIVKDREV